MFDKTSRYYNIPAATMQVRDSDGTMRQVQYVQRRIIPPVDNSLTIVEHIVIQGDRLDNITALYLVDPLQFWRVCDTNNVLRPHELTDEIGRVINIVLPHI